MDNFKKGENKKSRQVRKIIRGLKKIIRITDALPDSLSREQIKPYLVFSSIAEYHLERIERIFYRTLEDKTCIRLFAFLNTDFLEEEKVLNNYKNFTSGKPYNLTELRRRVI